MNCSGAPRGLVEQLNSEFGLRLPPCETSSGEYLGSVSFSDWKRGIRVEGRQWSFGQQVYTESGYKFVGSVDE